MEGLGGNPQACPHYAEPAWSCILRAEFCCTGSPAPHQPHFEWWSHQEGNVPAASRLWMGQHRGLVCRSLAGRTALGLRPLAARGASEARSFLLPLSREPGACSVLGMVRRGCHQSSGCPSSGQQPGGRPTKPRNLRSFPNHPLCPPQWVLVFSTLMESHTAADH